MRFLIFISATLYSLAFFSCKNQPDEPITPTPVLPQGATFMESSDQRSGDPAKGYQYLVAGDYISSGIPREIFTTVFGSQSADDLGRTGDNDGIPYDYTAVTLSSGAKIITANCLTCHAEYLNGQLVVGLGNNSGDYHEDASTNFNTLDFLVALRYGTNSPEYAAYTPLSRASKAIGPKILTKVKGPNPADKIFAVLAAHRSAADLTWIANPQFSIPSEVVPTDVPALWLMLKKNALYYNGLGRGDFARLSMASGMLTMLDSTEARRIDQKFPDVIAFLKTLKAPAYPHNIDASLAAAGKVIFEKNCSACHGTYGATSTYPNLRIEQATVGTDPHLANVYALAPQYHTWFNDSWFGKGPNAGKLEPTNGYVAPPLDGIWATAPYLHNASVPTLEDLLDSKKRPTYWRRSFDNSDYNTAKIGWNYETLTSKSDEKTYDTTLSGYGNQGHTYGDQLSDADRKALLEYLKGI